MNNLLFVNDSHEVILESIYTVRVKEAMNANPMKVSPDDTMRSAKNIMRDNGLTGLPVVDGNRLAGILSLYDIMACYDNGNLDEKVSKYMSRDVIMLEEDMPISFAINYFNKFKFRRFPVINKNKELTGMTIFARFKSGKTANRPYVRDADTWDYYYYVRSLSFREKRKWDDKMYFAPISRDEINRSDKKMVQNPGQ